MSNPSEGYPRTEAFLRYAAANCGVPAMCEEGHEAVDNDVTLTLQVLDIPQHIPKRKPRTVRIRVDRVRAGQLAVNGPCPDRPFEGTVVQSDHKAIRRGHEVIGLASRGCDEMLLVDTADSRDMEHLVETFSDPDYRRLVTI